LPAQGPQTELAPTGTPPQPRSPRRLYGRRRRLCSGRALLAPVPGEIGGTPADLPARTARARPRDGRWCVIFGWPSARKTVAMLWLPHPDYFMMAAAPTSFTLRDLISARAAFRSFAGLVQHGPLASLIPFQPSKLRLWLRRLRLRSCSSSSEDRIDSPAPRAPMRQLRVRAVLLPYSSSLRAPVIAIYSVSRGRRRSGSSCEAVRTIAGIEFVGGGQQAGAKTGRPQARAAARPAE